MLIESAEHRALLALVLQLRLDKAELLKWAKFTTKKHREDCGCKGCELLRKHGGA